MSKCELCLIAAASRNNVIGREGDLPWHIPADLKHFKQTTLGRPVIMGRATYDSLPIKPLPGRRNIVLTRRRDFSPAEGVEVFHTLEAALNAVQGEERVFIIGGGQIYAESLPKADTIYLTRIHKETDGDTFFPDIPETFEETERKDHPDYEPPFSFITYRRQDSA